MNTNEMHRPTPTTNPFARVVWYDEAKMTCWEESYKLPPLTGTPKQVIYGRDIRFRVLSKAFPLFDGMTAEQVQHLDRGRNLTDSHVWLEYFKPFANGDALVALQRGFNRLDGERLAREAAMAYAAAVAADHRARLEEARREKAEKAEREADLWREAKAWERATGMIPIRGVGARMATVERYMARRKNPPDGTGATYWNVMWAECVKGMQNDAGVDQGPLVLSE